MSKKNSGKKLYIHMMLQRTYLMHLPVSASPLKAVLRQVLVTACSISNLASETQKKWPESCLAHSVQLNTSLILVMFLFIFPRLQPL